MSESERPETTSVGIFASVEAAHTTVAMAVGVSPPDTPEKLNELLWRLDWLQRFGKGLYNPWDAEVANRLRGIMQEIPRGRFPPNEVSRLIFADNHGELGLFKTLDRGAETLEGLVRLFEYGQPLHPEVPGECLEDALAVSARRLSTLLAHHADLLRRAEQARQIWDEEDE